MDSPEEVFIFFQISLCYINLTKAKLKKSLYQGGEQCQKTVQILWLNYTSKTGCPLRIKPRAPQMSGVAGNSAKALNIGHHALHC